MKNRFLKENFYTIKDAQLLYREKNQFSINVLLNPGHEVYKGHFPQMPVAPGVCIIGMIQEILEEHLHRQLFLNEASDIKFIKPVLPREQNEFEIYYTLKFPSDPVVEASVIIKSGDEIFIKLKGKFMVLPSPS
jgi:3-hydroxyacyl-[acyl-carrier-protein] dehydratase